VSKEKDACVMRKFRPISLLNCSYKIFTKLLTNRINKSTNRLICSNQTTFIKGRYNLESVVVAHEIYILCIVLTAGAVLKLDCEKAYDRVNWDFLLDR